MTAYELDRRLPDGSGMTVTAFDPGLMPGTGLARDRTRLERLLWHGVLPLFRFLPGVKSPTASGRDLAWLVVDPDGQLGHGSWRDTRWSVVGYVVHLVRRIGPCAPSSKARTSRTDGNGDTVVPGNREPVERPVR
jgi:hypothetical protein